MKLRKFNTLALTVLCSTSFALAYAVEPDPQSFEHPVIAEIQALHMKSEKGDKATTIPLIAKLEALTTAHPENQLYKAYLGSTYTLRSRDIGFGPSALSYLKKGLKTMDAAVEAAPDKASVRFIRAINNFSLPVFINRRDNARADFETLVKKIDGNPENLSPVTQQAIYYYAGLSFLQLRRKEDAKKSLAKGAALNADPQLNVKIAAELKKL
jgi:hypothetical protein